MSCLTTKSKDMHSTVCMLGFTNPHQDIIKRYRQLGGEMITIGSDGHFPEYLGYGFDMLPEYLKACGFKYYIVFVEKKPQFMVIQTILQEL